MTIRPFRIHAYSFLAKAGLWREDVVSKIIMASSIRLERVLWDSSCEKIEAPKEKEAAFMTPVTFILATIGVSYTSWLLMRFIVWLDTPGDSANRAEDC